jgi:hypothetical protein
MGTAYDDPKVAPYLDKYGELGVIVLVAFNAADPCIAVISLDGADGYLEEACSFMENLKKEKSLQSFEREYLDDWAFRSEFVEELVRRSFSPTVLINSPPSEDMLRRIAHVIEPWICPRELVEVGELEEVKKEE